MKESFGKTDDVTAVRTFREAAIADGWAHEHTYANHEPEESACTLKRDGFTLMTLSRDARGDRGYTLKCCASLHAWGPDGLSLRLNDWQYPGWQWFLDATQTCNLCGKRAETFRFSFAGRACRECLPQAKAESEKPGWDN